MTGAATATHHGRVREVRLSAPERGNAIDLDSAAELAKVLAVGPEVGALALTHDGPNFCVGGDVRGFAAAPDPEAYLLDLANAAHECVRALTNAGVPVVIGARGWAAGAIASRVVPDDEHLDYEARSIAAAGASPEGSEGIRAFLEKRPARYHFQRPDHG